VNGQEVYSRSNLNFTNNEEFREVNRFWMNVYHGGGSPAPNDMSVYFKQFNFSFGVDSTNTACHGS